MQTSKLSNIVMIVVFALFIGGIAVVNLMVNDRRYSELENKYLLGQPELSKETLLNGEFMEDYESYLIDQFVLKDSLIKLKASSEKFLHKLWDNGTYFAEDGFLIQKYEPNKEQLDKNIGYILQLIENLGDTKVYVMTPPTQAEIYKDKLPLYTLNGNQKEDYAFIKEQIGDKAIYVDVYDILKQMEKEHIYFKTDHHWTMRGAYYAYSEFLKTMGMDVKEMSAYEQRIAAEQFFGTMYSNTPVMFQKGDKLEIFINPNGDYTVDYVDVMDENLKDKLPTDSLFVWDNLEKKDKYTVFLDGNHAILTIKNNLVDNGRKLLLLKDSYAHAMIPFLADDFEEIHVVDIRYFKQSMPLYASQNGITEVMLLYNMEFISTSTELLWLSKK